MAGERVNIFSPFQQQQQQSNAYVLPPQCQPVGDKLIIPFSGCQNCVLEIFMIITSLMVIGFAPTYAKIYTAVFFLIEQFCVLFSAKKRVEIIKDENKKICPNPDCESFLQKSELTKYVECENGHKYCFECLKPPHGDKSCDYQEEKQFLKWTKGKRVKRCPRCRMYTEKNEGCNHMTCASCKYQWCWLCEGQYIYGHYDSGKCNGHQFTKADSLEEANQKKKVIKFNYRPQPSGCGLHRIFPCVLPQAIHPFDPQDSCLDYLFILGFWFFGAAVFFIWVVMEYLTTKLDILSECLEIASFIFAFGMGITIFVCFQIPFFCLITPFMIISLIYYPLFYKFIFFFSMGEKN
jgi:hypothetical protein